ncbi:hypothetical protein OUZ56_017764, partial [Daphnia magna]
MSKLGLPWAKFSIQRLRALSSGVGHDLLPFFCSRPNWRSRMKSQSAVHGSVPASSSQGRKTSSMYWAKARAALFHSWV